VLGIRPRFAIPAGGYHAEHVITCPAVTDVRVNG
jgi:hypothetical protein